MRLLCGIITASLFIGVGALVLQPVLASSADPDLLLTPATIELNLDPGQTRDSKVTIVNNSDHDRVFDIKLISFASGDDQGKPLLDASLVTPLHDWLKLPSPTFTVPAKQHLDYNFAIAVPQAAGPGSYRTILMFSDRQVTPDDSGSVITAQTGPLIFVRVSGEANEAAGISTFTVDRVNETLPVTFQTTLANSGNVDIVPVGVINITPEAALGSQSTVSFDFNPKAGKTLAATNRNYISDWQDGQMHIGYYKAELVLAYGQSNTVVTAVSYFWVIPWKLLGGLLCVVLAVGIVIRVRSKSEV